jgi:hypothetical protein
MKITTIAPYGDLVFSPRGERGGLALPRPASRLAQRHARLVKPKLLTEALGQELVLGNDQGECPAGRVDRLGTSAHNIQTD